MPAFHPVSDPETLSPGRVLAKAVVNAADELGLSQQSLARIIGVSPATVSRMKGGGFDLSGKPMELAACLVRVFLSLDASTGGDPKTMRGWISNPNADLHGIPAELIERAEGLVLVLAYLDAARAPT